MQGFAKAIVISILVSVSTIIFINLSMFFPWYMTLVTETFNLSQIVASDNYLKQAYYNDILDRLKDRPIYRDKSDRIELLVRNSSDLSAIGDNDETVYLDKSDFEKPYRQRGEPISVEIRAVFPFSITLWGEEYEKELPVSFSMMTTGLKHYKDLEFYFN